MPSTRPHGRSTSGWCARGATTSATTWPQTRMNLGIALRNQGRLEEAVAEYQAAREIRERLVREGRDDLRDDLAKTRMNLGIALTTTGPTGRSRRRVPSRTGDLRAVGTRGTRRPPQRPGHDADEPRHRLADTGPAGRKQSPSIQAAREIRERLVREGRDDLRDDLATTRMNLGNALRQQGRLEDAVAEFQAAREIYERLVREGRDDLRNDLAARG